MDQSFRFIRGTVNRSLKPKLRFDSRLLTEKTFMRKRLTGAGIIILLLSFGIKFTSSPVQSPEIEEEDFVKKKKIVKKRLPASVTQKKSRLMGNRSQGPQFTVSGRSQEEAPHFVDEPGVRIENSPEVSISWSGSGPRENRRPSWKEESKSQIKQRSDAKVISTSPFYTSPLPSNEAEENKAKNPKVPVCSVGITGGSFQGPVNIELTCSTASSIKYCISENNCCDPEQGRVYTGAFKLGQASKTLCLSFAGTSFEDQITSETKEALYSFDPELPHLEITQNKTHIQTTQLDAAMVFKSNDFGSNHHALGVINLKSHDPSPSALNMSCTDIVTNHASLTSPTPGIILTEMNASAFSPTTQMNLFLTEHGLIYGENYLTAYMKSMLYDLPQYSCSSSKLALEDFNYVQTLPVDVIAGNDDTELYGGFTAVSALSPDPSLYRGPASEIGDVPTQELRTGLISIFFDK